ncbi:MAG: response regulator transcription factor [Dehalococcoidia bacterium]
MATAAEPHRVLVVDDDPTVASLLRRGLTYAGFTASVAHSGPEALQAVHDHRPDIVILDVMMPDMDGVEVCRRLRSTVPDLPIIMLTARDSTDDEIAGLEAGADDYVRKPFSFEVLTARLQALLRRHGADDTNLQYGDLTLDVPGRLAYRGERRIDLTTTEFDVLSLLVEHAGHVISKEQILEHVWGYDFGGNTNIVEVYVRALRVKLEAAGEPRLIQTVRGAGYVLRDA